MVGAHDDLIPHYVDYLRRRSHLAAEFDVHDALELAAHLFTVAQQLVDDGHDLRGLELGDEIESIEQLESRLSSLSTDTGARELYRLLTTALHALERSLIDHSPNQSGYQYRNQYHFDIDEISIGHHRALGGQVVSWFRPPGSFRHFKQRSFESARQAGALLPQDSIEQPNKHLGRLFCHWQRGNERPRVGLAEPEVEDFARPLIRVSGRCMEDEAVDSRAFRIALCPLVDNSRPFFKLLTVSGQRSFRAKDPLINASAAREHLQTILDLAAENEVHLIVLPELCIDEATRDWLSTRLSRIRKELPFGVITGSFHFEKTGLSRPYNESLLVDQSGRKLLEHWKRGRFEINKRGIQVGLELDVFEDRKRWEAELTKPHVEVEEHIEPGDKIELLETTLGQIAVLICADAIDTNNRREMRDAVTRLRPDFVFIPAMSPETDRFEDFATEMERLGVATFFVNAHCFCPEGQVLAAVCLDLYRGEGDPPTRVRWRQGRGLEQWLRKKRHGDDGDWVSLDPLGTPVDWLSSPEGERLGLVVDLGAYWRPEEEASASGI